MKMYDFTLAPSPRRVRIFLAEKGIDVELVQVDIMRNANRTPEFYKKNPLGSLPILELDDGSYLRRDRLDFLVVAANRDALRRSRKAAAGASLNSARFRSTRRSSASHGSIRNLAVANSSRAPITQSRTLRRCA